MGSSQTLIDILTLYGASLSDLDIVNDKAIYYIKIYRKKLVMTLDDTLVNIFKILNTFTYPNDDSKQVDLKYEVIDDE